MFDNLEELFTQEEIAARKSEKVASLVQSVTDRLAAAKQTVAELENELEALSPKEESHEDTAEEAQG